VGPAGIKVRAPLFGGIKFLKVRGGVLELSLKDRDAPNGVKSMYSIAIPAPSSLILLAGGLAAQRNRHVCGASELA